MIIIREIKGRGGRGDNPTPPHTQKREKERKLSDKEEEKKTISREGRRRPFPPKSLNITAVYDIFHHGYTLIAYGNPPNPPFVVSSIPGQINSVYLRLIPCPGLICSTSYVSAN